MSKLILAHVHGAALRPRPTDMAFPHRDPGYSVLIIAQWREPEESERNIAWAKETYALLEPFLRPGVYSNYLSGDESLARLKVAYGDNFPRLQRLKARYDLANRFHHNQNIPPRSSGRAAPQTG